MAHSAQMSLKAAVLDAVRLEMERDPNVFYLGEDVGAAEGVFKQTAGLYRQFGAERVIDTPISEPAIVGAAIGAAMCGLRPIVEIMFGDFITLAMDQLVNQAAKIRYMSAGAYTVPLVLRTAVGIGGALGPQHSQALYAWLAHVPGLKVACPATPADAKGLMASAIRDDDPVIFVEDRMTYNTKGAVPQGEHLVPFGVAEVKKAGTDVTIIAVSRMLKEAMEAAAMLEALGVSAEVVDPRTLVPLDAPTLAESVRKTSRALVVDGGVQRYGITGEIVATLQDLAFDYLDAPVARMGAAPVPVAANRELERRILPDRERITACVTQMLGIRTPGAALGPDPAAAIVDQ